MFQLTQPTLTVETIHHPDIQYRCPGEYFDPRSRPFTITLCSPWKMQRNHRHTNAAKSISRQEMCIFTDPAKDEFTVDCYSDEPRKDVDSFLHSWNGVKSTALRMHSYWVVKNRGYLGGLAFVEIKKWDGHPTVYAGSGLLIVNSKIITLDIHFNHKPTDSECDALIQMFRSIDMD